MVLAFIATGPVSARQGLAIRDSVVAISDIAVLRGIMDDSPARPDVPDLLRRGFAGMRLFDIAGDVSAAKLARRSFDEATDRDPGDALAWFGLGMSWADGPEAMREPPAIVAGRAFAEALGMDPASRALRAFRRALELDPELLPAATALVPLALDKHDDSALRLARIALAAAEAEGRFDADALAALARASAALGLHDRAVEAARRASVMNGASPADRYALAIALFGAGRDEEGARTWFGALANVDSLTAERYHRDLRPLTDDWEEGQWQRAGLAGRADWLRDFWVVRAALGGVGVPQRIGDHYRRLASAFDRYPRRRKWGAPPTNALLLERPDLPFDDRGLIYVRHGEPFDILRSATSQFQVHNESWIYRTPEGGFTALHFFNYGSSIRAAGVAGNSLANPADGGFGDGYNEFLLVYNLPCAGDWHAGVERYDRRLSLLRCNEFDRRSLSAEIRRDARLALRTDSDRPAFDRELPFVYDISAFRGTGGATDVTAALSLPSGSIVPAPAWGGVAYDVATSIVFVDTMFDRVARADTLLRTVTAAPLRPEDALRVHVTLAVEPGNAQALRITARSGADPRQGQLYGQTVDVPDFDRDVLMLSDIVLAEPDSGGSFRRGRVALSLVPSGEFPGGAFRAFYEVYNTTPDATFSTELIVEKAGGGVGGVLRGLFGGGPEVRLRFETVADPVDRVVQEVRRVDTSLEPGEYRIRVRVEDPATGRAAQRERRFTVVR